MIIKRKLIVDDVNNGKVINDFYNQWHAVENAKEHKSLMNLILKTRFGTYQQYGVLDLLERFNAVTDFFTTMFITEIKTAYEKDIEGV